MRAVERRVDLHHGKAPGVARQVRAAAGEVLLLRDRQLRCGGQDESIAVERGKQADLPLPDDPFVAPVQARTRVAMDLRSGPHVSHAVVARVARASWVEVRGCGVPEGWCEVVHQGRSAWGLADAIERGGPSASDTGAPPDAGAPTTGPADPPIVIVVFDELPATDTGKLARRRLVETFDFAELDAGEHVFVHARELRDLSSVRVHARPHLVEPGHERAGRRCAPRGNRGRRASSRSRRGDRGRLAPAVVLAEARRLLPRARAGRRRT